MAAQPRLTAAGLNVVAIRLGSADEPSGEQAAVRSPDMVRVSPDVVTALELFRSAEDGGETDVLLDRNGNIRARWTANSGLASAAVLAADAQRVARFAVTPPKRTRCMTARQRAQ